MDFIAKHYEKLILAVSLVCLIWCTNLVSSRNHNAIKEARGAKSEAQRQIKKGELVETLDGDSLATLDSMLARQDAFLNILKRPGHADAAALFEGGQFIICKNKKCGYFLPFTADTCPYCGTEQDPIGAELTMEDDLDGDGIPDLVEKATLGLNYRYPFDSVEDFDGDGFLNIEEYRAGTNPSDGESRPQLAYLLRSQGGAVRLKLPFALKRIKDAGGSPNVEDWKANLDFGKNKVGDFKLNTQIRNTGFTIISFDNDKSGMTVRDDEGTEYHLTAGEPAVEEETPSVRFLYLSSHNRFAYRVPRTLEDMQKLPEEKLEEEIKARGEALRANRGAMGPGMGMGMGMEGAGGMGAPGMASGAPQGETILVFTLHVNDTFVLSLPKMGTTAGEGGAMGRPTMGMPGMGGMPGGMGMSGEAIEYINEYYRLLPVVAAEDGAQQILVQQLTSLNGEPVGAPIPISELDNSPNSHDFMSNQGTMGGGMPGGFPGPAPMMRR